MKKKAGKIIKVDAAKGAVKKKKNHQEYSFKRLKNRLCLKKTYKWCPEFKFSLDHGLTLFPFVLPPSTFLSVFHCPI